jgi:starch synthase
MGPFLGTVYGRGAMTRVLFLTAEAAPFTKVGGLGDVAGSLPRALRALPSRPDVRVVTPIHGGAGAKIKGPLERVCSVSVPHPAGVIRGDFFACTHGGVPFYFLRSPGLFDDDIAIYHHDTGWDGHRYAFFSLAALELARTIDFLPEVVHAHDWHTAPAVAAIHRARFVDPALASSKSVLTIHNLPYVGIGAGPAMSAFGLTFGDLSLVPFASREMPLPIGLALADRITTVSPGYAREILEPEFGAGLDALLRARKGVIHGILNGVDTELWDPETDSALASPFDVERIEARLENKRALQRELRLPEDRNVPLVAAISRLTEQKGIDLVPDALRLIAREHAFQCIVLGSGDGGLEAALLGLEAELEGRLRVRIAFDDGLSRRIYGGSDFLMLPSRYEPCGLAQMIAMRYGCVPLARDTGGLSDTVRDLDLNEEPTGILFPVASSRSLAFALRRGIATYRQPRRFRMLQENGMRADFSWTRAALEYARIYEDLASLESRS